MVNENKGLEYNPTPVYDRKLIRSVMRSKIEKRNGFHNVNKKLHDGFRKYQELRKENA